MIFFLFLVLILALVAGPEIAQTQTFTLNINANYSVDGSSPAPMAANHFAIVTPASPGTNGISLPAAAATADEVPALTNILGSLASDLPNLADRFAFGGTIELVFSTADLMEGSPDQVTDPAMYRPAITEIMWGEDAGQRLLMVQQHREPISGLKSTTTVLP